MPTSSDIFETLSKYGYIPFENTGTDSIARFADELGAKITSLEREVDILKLVVLGKITKEEYQSLVSQFESKDKEVLVLAAALLEELKKR